MPGWFISHKVTFSPNLQNPINFFEIGSVQLQDSCFFSRGELSTFARLERTVERSPSPVTGPLELRTILRFLT